MTIKQPMSHGDFANTLRDSVKRSPSRWVVEAWRAPEKVRRLLEMQPARSCTGPKASPSEVTALLVNCNVRLTFASNDV